MDLVEFLRARLDEDGQVARAATGERWQAEEPEPDDEKPHWLSIALATSGDDVAETRGDHGAEYAVHIARHDPARVLAEVEAKRRVLDRHQSVMMLGGHHECWVCGDVFPCDDVKLLALPFASHPDYLAEWKP